MDFVRQWKTIRPGMTAHDVRARLGKPYTSYIPTDGADRIEYWLFARTDWTVVPPPESYVIYYDHSGRVSNCSPPRTQPE